MESGFISRPMKDPEDYLTLEEAGRIIAAGKDYRQRLLMTTLLHTGCRVSEIVKSNGTGLRRRDADLEAETFNITDLKKRVRARVPIPIDKELAEKFKIYLTTFPFHNEDYLFPITRCRAWQIVRRAGTIAGVDNKRLHPHIFRHTFAIHAAKTAINPADIVKVQRILRHTRIDTTMFYLQFSQADVKELLTAMWRPAT